MHRFFALITLFILSLLLAAGCVSIPPQTQLVYSDPGHNGLIASAAESFPRTETSLSSAAECSIEHFRSALQQQSLPAQQLNPQYISMINWNIYKAQEENWSEDFSALIENRDLVLIQEAVNQPRVTQLLDHQHPYWHLNNAFYYEGHEAGVLTASRRQAIFSCGIRTSEPLIRIPKTVLINLYPLAGSEQKLLVANLHGINFSLGTGAYSEQIEQMVRIIQQHEGPLIIAGDFNSWSEARNQILNNMIEGLSLQSLSYENHNRITLFGHALDHVFYRGLELIHEETRQVSSSDHNPIKASFRLPRTLAQK